MHNYMITDNTVATIGMLPSFATSEEQKELTNGVKESMGKADRVYKLKSQNKPYNAHILAKLFLTLFEETQINRDNVKEFLSLLKIRATRKLVGRILLSQKASRDNRIKSLIGNRPQDKSRTKKRMYHKRDMKFWTRKMGIAVSEIKHREPHETIELEIPSGVKK